MPNTARWANCLIQTFFPRPKYFAEIKDQKVKINILNKIGGQYQNLKIYDKAIEHLDESQIKRPEHWGGYAVIPQSVEFWQGRDNRLHDRIRYQKVNDQWNLERLAP